jgi:hypothetical protein
MDCDLEGLKFQTNKEIKSNKINEQEMKLIDKH